MSRSDIMRWRDWKKIREPSRCRACRKQFMPDIPWQRFCRQCAHAEAEKERAPVTADEIERQQLRRELKLIDIAEARKRGNPIPLALPPSARARLERKASRTMAAIADQPVKQRAKGKRARRSSAPQQWAHVAQAKRADGWSPRKIAKFLGVSVEEVLAWSALSAEQMRWRAAADGKLDPAPVEPERRSGELLWCRAQRQGSCHLCRRGVFRGDKLARVDEKWVHTACAEGLGYTIVSPDRRSPLQRKLDARRAER